MTTEPSSVTVAQRFDVEGIVQGVGFRPFVYRLASEHDLDGFVGNDATHVFIEVTGSVDAVEAFARDITAKAPALATIDRIKRSRCASASEPGFRIVESRAGGTTIDSSTRATLVPPDVATCDRCVADLFDPSNRRFNHPFVTCTDCGPRFTIIESMPYDRPATTMAGFEMCGACRAEYEDPGDRRYHAQPIACHDCGPTLTYHAHGAPLETRRWLESTIAALGEGATVAIKGLGGYHLACDATNDDAVQRLRERKRRPDKPFALIVRDLEHAGAFAHIDRHEGELLTSSAAPIVLLAARADSAVSELVAPANPLIGIMVASTPLHHMLFAHQHRPLVMTSANRVGEPLAHNHRAIAALADLYDARLDHDRDILVPCDDSVMRVVEGTPLPIRRARGYAPIPLAFEGTSTAVLATGGELKNTFCVADQGRAWVSQHIGDMENLETLQSFEMAIAQFKRMYDVEPRTIAVDSHPNYLSSRWGRQQSQPVREVQHHHAHITSIMAEHRLDPHDNMIGFAFDGTGYGADGSIWGGELLIANAFGFQRHAHLDTFALPGGDQAVRNPFRVALALLHQAGVEWDPRLHPVRAGNTDIALHKKQLESGFGTTQTSSMGRLFDAIASLVDLRHTVSFEAQAAIDLEFCAGSYENAPVGRYRFGLDGDRMQWQPVVEAIAADVLAHADPGLIAVEFHDAVADIVCRSAERVRTETGLSTVALSGGVFQNVLLARLCLHQLHTARFTVFTHQTVPPNDGGLALGQAYIAAHCASTASPSIEPSKEF